MNGRQIGGLIGAVGGLSFVLSNAGELPVSMLWRVLGVFGFVTAVGLMLAKAPAAPPVPAPRALRTYWLCVLGEVLAIPAGAAVLRALGHVDLVPAWVVLVVGVHFLPFATAFKVPMFRTLGLVLVGIAVLGMGGTLAGVELGVRIAAVAAGFVLFAAVVAGSRSDDHEPSAVS